MTPTRPLLCAILALSIFACGGEGDGTRTTNAADTATVAQPQAPDSMSGADTIATTSQDTPQASPPRRPRDTTAVDTPSSLPAQRPPAQLDIPRLLRETSNAYAGMRTLQADFTMVTQNPLVGSRVTSRGTLYQRRPDRILLRFEQPQGDVILGDGEYFWIYYPSTDPGQVIRTRAAEAAAGRVDLWAQFVGDPVRRFEHTYHGMESVEGREAAVVTLLPHQDPGYRQLKVWIDTRDHLVRRFEVTEHNGTVRLIELHDLQANPALADTLFRFTPPPGVRVVDR